MSKVIARVMVWLHKGLSPLREGILVTLMGYVSKCQHSPTCSEYMLEQVEKHGWRGFWRGAKRLLTCF